MSKEKKSDISKIIIGDKVIIVDYDNNVVEIQDAKTNTSQTVSNDAQCIQQRSSNNTHDINNSMSKIVKNSAYGISPMMGGGMSPMMTDNNIVFLNRYFILSRQLFPDEYYEKIKKNVFKDLNHDVQPGIKIDLSEGRRGQSLGNNIHSISNIRLTGNTSGDKQKGGIPIEMITTTLDIGVLSSVGLKVKLIIDIIGNYFVYFIPDVNSNQECKSRYNNPNSKCAPEVYIAIKDAIAMLNNLFYPNEINCIAGQTCIFECAEKCDYSKCNEVDRINRQKHIIRNISNSSSSTIGLQQLKHPVDTPF